MSEAVLSRTILTFTRALPDRALRPLSLAIGCLLSGVLAGRRRVVQENVRLAYRDSITAPDSRSLSRESFANLCRSFLELARLPEDVEVMRSCFEVKRPEAWQKVLALVEEGPVVIATAHFGAYEMGGIAASCLGVPLTTLVRPLDNPWLDHWLGGIRRRFGQGLAGNRGGFRSIARCMREGRSVCVLVDLNKRGKSVFVDYFGEKAATAATAAVLAIRARRPMIPVFVRRENAPMRFSLDICDPIWPDPRSPASVEIPRLLQAATSELEKRVRAEPEQWLWTHRRWKSRPPVEAGPDLGSPASLEKETPS